MKYFDLDDEEKQILAEFESGKLVSEKKSRSEKKKYEKYAKETLAKTKNINIRLAQKDLLKLKSEAANFGIPYQTLIASILHLFANKKDKGLCVN